MSNIHYDMLELLSKKISQQIKRTQNDVIGGQSRKQKNK